MPDRATNAWQEALDRGASAETWRDVEDLLDTPGFRERLAEEFPAGADALSRRGFLNLLGASAALAGLSGCMQEPRDKIVPYTKMPPDITPGHPLHYATSMVLDGVATGLLVTAREGRPIKIEGNPEHPASLGGTGVFDQALLLQLYDPQRAGAVLNRGAPAPWRTFASTFQLSDQDDGSGLRILLEPTSSLLIADQLGRLRQRRPKAKIYFHSPLSESTGLRAMQTVAGQALQPIYDFSKASVVVSIDDDFLSCASSSPRYSRQFADRRRQPEAGLNRLYMVESTLSVTGSIADHRWARRPSQLPGVVAGLLAEVGSPVGGIDAGATEADRRWIQVIARDLKSHRGDSLVVAGAHLPVEVHAAVHLMNVALGNVGHALQYIASPILEAGTPSHELRGLAEEIRAGSVTRLLIVEGNPAYAAPVDLEFAALIQKVPQSAFVGLFRNETAAAAGWNIPLAHLLESWGDARAFDGTVSIVQPLIAPLHDGRTLSEVLAVLLGDQQFTAHQLLRNFWRGRPEAATDAAWETLLKRGVLPNSALPSVSPALQMDAVRGLLANWRVAPSEGIEVQWRPDYKVYDGRFANNAWLQELPEPMTKLTWGNAAYLSPTTAARLDVESGQVLRISRAGRSLEIPALVLPGHADESMTLPLGYGRDGVGEELCQDVGANAYRLLTSDVRGRASTATAVRTGRVEALAITQTHWSMEGRDIALTKTLAEQQRQPTVKQERPLTLYDAFAKDASEQWGMAIDLGVCTGCSACVVACQAENNIPVVGKDGVLKSREMHWIRIDRYFTGTPENPGVVTQPMLCQHCEKAPCEYVCPVNATTHSPDGINEMTYNRCVGTRFCSNNCPYKVRRFNWFNYNAHKPPTLQLAMNPQVTVRARGVIEKCNYCIQRVRNTQIAAQIERRPIRDMEVQTACQQACPTRAITFGNLVDPTSAVSRQMRNPRTYSVLSELGTQPRTRYLVRVTNPNPELG